MPETLSEIFIPALIKGQAIDAERKVRVHHEK